MFRHFFIVIADAVVRWTELIGTLASISVVYTYIWISRLSGVTPVQNTYRGKLASISQDVLGSEYFVRSPLGDIYIEI